MAKAKGSPKTGGRGPNTPNKSTAAAREAIALFVDGNAHRLQAWLDTIAEGSFEEKEDGTKELLIAPNPIKAFELFQSVIEYHVPKLARTEMTGKDGEKLEVNVVRYTVTE